VKTGSPAAQQAAFLDNRTRDRHKPAKARAFWSALFIGCQAAVSDIRHRLKEAGPGQTPENRDEHEDDEMFAVIKTGGKQYRVAADDVITVDRLAGEPGDAVQFGEVLLVGGDSVQVGSPTVGGASVAGKVIEQSRGPKVIAFKKRRRKNSRRKRGHRQEFTRVRITEILTEGRKPEPRSEGEAS
jgi:large subunit ribosomal protein L21